MAANALTVEICNDLTRLQPGDFNRLSHADNPFVEHEFLSALEVSGCVGDGTPWLPHHHLLREDGKLVAAIPFYVKHDSYGEYIFDWEWANAFQRAGLEYYPKGLAAIPFTPATGTRILLAPEASLVEHGRVLVEALVETARRLQLSSLHFLFVQPDEARLLEDLGFATRYSHQFHWRNRGYESFDQFLGDLRAKRRKEIRRERRTIDEANLRLHHYQGEKITSQHIEAMWSFYQDTTSRKWGRPYLNRAFFQQLFQHFRHRMLLVLAEDDKGYAAGTVNFQKGGRLFGRYWGEQRSYKNLHFECCFYTLIERAIEQKAEWAEAGAQGEHKFLRGFEAVLTYSSHLIFDGSAKAAIESHLEREREHMQKMVTGYNQRSPVKALYGR